MTTPEQLQHPETIGGYTYGQPETSHSPLTIQELRQLEAAAGLTVEDERYLRAAAEILTPQAADMVDAWRALLAQHDHIAVYGAHPDGTPNPEYASASHPRFARWVIDVCTRPRDQAWLDYQHEIGLRHTRAGKNATDDADAPPFIPLRYVLAFLGPVLVTSRDFLARGHLAPDELDQIHGAWIKAVTLNVTVWSRAYVGSPDQW